MEDLRKGGGKLGAVYYGHLTGAATGYHSGREWQTIMSTIVRGAKTSFSRSSIMGSKKRQVSLQVNMGVKWGALIQCRCNNPSFYSDRLLFKRLSTLWNRWTC